MPSVYITPQLYEYLQEHLTDDSIDATIRKLIFQRGLGSDGDPLDDSDTSSTDIGLQILTQDETSVGGKGDSTNSGYIR